MPKSKVKKTLEISEAKQFIDTMLSDWGLTISDIEIKLSKETYVNAPVNYFFEMTIKTGIAPTSVKLGSNVDLSLPENDNALLEVYRVAFQFLGKQILKNWFEEK